MVVQSLGICSAETKVKTKICSDNMKLVSREYHLPCFGIHE